MNGNLCGNIIYCTEYTRDIEVKRRRRTRNLSFSPPSSCSTREHRERPSFVRFCPGRFFSISLWVPRTLPPFYSGDAREASAIRSVCVCVCSFQGEKV